MSATLHLVAHVAGRGVLFDACRVDSVVDLGEVTPVPGAGGAVIGLAAMRSRVATVLDARRLLGLSSDDEAAGGRAVVTAVDGHLYAIAVDTLEDVAAFDLAPLPGGLAGTDEWGAACGVVEGAGETLVALDLDRLVARAVALP
jgi:purine-binding chemotaxis protein CheW